MKTLYVIYDLVAKEAGPVFESVNDAVALRSFGKVMDTAYSPKDYELFCVGYIDKDMVVTPELRRINISVDMEVVK